MLVRPNEPPREFRVGLQSPIVLKDCGQIMLNPDEQVSFVTESGSQYDVCRKSWGFYATPSLNGRLHRFRLRGALVINQADQLFVLLVEAGREEEFLAYLRLERSQLLTWLDRDEHAVRLRTVLVAGGALGNASTYNMGASERETLLEKE